MILKTEIINGYYQYFNNKVNKTFSHKFNSEPNHKDKVKNAANQNRKHESCLPTKGRLPTKVVFHRGSSSTNLSSLPAMHDA